MKKKVLVIDDNEMMRSFLQHILGGSFDATVVSSGEEAFELLESADEIPDLVFSDFDLDRMSGYELPIYLKNTPGYRHLPVVIMSGKGDSHKRLICKAGGAVDFITKPFNPAELQARFRQILAESTVNETSE